MAESNDTAAGGNGNLLEAIKPLVFELRLAFEGVAAGIKSLAKRPESTFIRDELLLLAKMLSQGAESIDDLEGILSAPEQEAGQ